LCTKWQQDCAWSNLNPKHEIPAFAEAASRKQANFETISNVQNPKRQGFFVWVI
jgi:hypothetical protein